MILCPCGNVVRIKYCRKCRPIKGGQPKKIWKIMVGNELIEVTTQHPLYKKRMHMIERCTNPKEADKKYYKNISVCPQWRKDAFSFFEWALNNGWKKELTIDRIDPTQDYTPSNCRWIPFADNIRRRRIGLNYKTPADELEIRRLYKEGFSRSQIRKKLNLKDARVKYVIDQKIRKELPYAYYA